MSQYSCIVTITSCLCVVVVLLYSIVSNVSIIDRLLTSVSEVRVRTANGFFKGSYDSCEELLRGRSYNDQRHGVGCEIRTFSISDAFQCMKTAAEETKLPNNIVFLGDSRVREQYHHFLLTIGSDEDSTEYVNALYSLRVRFEGHFQRLNNQFIDTLLRILNSTVNETERPRLLVLSSALWDIKLSCKNFESGLLNYKEVLLKARPLFERLSQTTEILWTMQAPVLKQLPKPSASNNVNRSGNASITGDQCDKSVWLTNSYVDQYNEAARQILANTSVRFWVGSRLAAHRHMFEMYDAVHFIKCSALASRWLVSRYNGSYERMSRLHPHLVAQLYVQRMKFGLIHLEPTVSKAMEERSQALLNFYCNRYLHKSRIGGRKYCCTEHRETRL